MQILHRFGIPEVLILMYLSSPILTSLNNGDAIVLGDITLPGVGLYDALSNVELSFITLIPFFIGRQFLGRSDAILEIFGPWSLPELFTPFLCCSRCVLAPNFTIGFMGIIPANSFNRCVKVGIDQLYSWDMDC
jgi:hypothetical protein